jgi:hypothetical protein
MKLDRNHEAMGKYALVCIRKLDPIDAADFYAGAREGLDSDEIGVRRSAIELGEVGSEDEFFVLKLKDEFASVALNAYAYAAEEYDPEYADQIRELAARAYRHPSRKRPD